MANESVFPIGLGLVLFVGGIIGIFIFPLKIGNDIISQWINIPFWVSVFCIILGIILGAIFIIPSILPSKNPSGQPAL